MNFDLSSDQQLLVDSAQRFIRDEYSLRQRAELIAAAKDRWASFAHLGWLGVCIPEEYGGIGGTFSDLALLCEALGHGLVLEPYLGSVLAAQVILAGATAEQCAILIPRIVEGSEIFALANVEDAARGRLAYIETIAVPTATGYRIRGHKTAILGGPRATDLIVAARTSGHGSDPAGITLFHIAVKTPRLRLSNYHMIDHMAVADAFFDDIEVPSAALIGERGCALAALERSTDVAILAGAADAIGSMTEALTLTCAFLQSRKQFGVPLSEFQALRHRLADMQVQVELARSGLFRGLAGLESPDGRTRALAASSAKLTLAQASRHIGGHAVQLHGGIGVTDEYAIGHHFKHLTVLNSLFGTDDYHIARIGELCP